MNSKAKGNRGERMAVDAICSLLGRDKTAQDRRNYQFTVYGGAGNPDIEVKGLEDLFFEVKNTKSYQFGSWTRKILEDCPASRVPTLLYHEPRGPWWIQFRLEDVEKLSASFLTAMGWRVEK